MPIEQNCPHCGRVYRFPEKHLGTQVKCPGCSRDFDVTGLTEIDSGGGRVGPKKAKPAKPSARPAVKKGTNSSLSKDTDIKFAREETTEKIEKEVSEDDIDFEALKKELKEKKEPKHEVPKSLEQRGLGEGPAEPIRVDVKKGLSRLGFVLGFAAALAMVIIRVSLIFNLHWWSTNLLTNLYERLGHTAGLALLLILAGWLLGRLIGWAALGFRQEQPSILKRGSSARDRLSSKRRR